MTFSFKRLHSSRGYWLVLSLFVLANAWSMLRHHLGEPECCDRLQSSGFPFPFHVSGGIAGRDDLLVTGLLLDIVIAWTLAVLVAWLALAWRAGRESVASE